MRKSNISKLILSFAFILLAFAGLGGIFLQTASMQKSESVYAAGSIEAIGSADALVQLAEEVNSGTSYSGKTVYLTKDIDLSGKVWTPIGKNSSYSFRGTFDGRGFTIKGLTILNEMVPNLDYVGLFGYTSYATIRNVTLDLVNIDYNSNSTGVGALVGKAYATNVYDCATFGAVKSSSNARTGGIVGDFDIYGTMSNCYSYAKVDGSNNYAGGLVGYAGANYDEEENPYEPDIKNSFFAGVTSSGYSGLYANGDANVIDCYTIECKPLNNSVSGFVSEIKGSVTQYKKVDNTSSWITDTSSMMSHGSGRQVLKGVGNIVLEQVRYAFNKSTGAYIVSSSSTNIVRVVTYDTSSTITNTTTKITADANNTFTSVRYERVVSSENQIIANRDSFFNNGKSGGNNNNTFIVGSEMNSALLKEGGFTITFRADGDFSDNSSYKPETSYNINSKNFYVPKNLQGYYKIETRERGRLVAVQSNAKTYANPSKTAQSSTGSKFEISNYITMTISACQKDEFNSNYTDLISEKTGKNLKLFYRPYGESYTVIFENNKNTANEFDYLGKVKGYKRYLSASVTSSKSDQSAINSADKSADQNVKLTSLSKEYSITESSGVTKDCVINYYFDNVFDVTINDGRAESNFASQIQKWYSNYSTQNGGEKIVVGVMLYEKISDKGIGYNGSIIKNIREGDELYPFWSDFACDGIIEKVDSGDAVMHFQQNGNVLTPNSSTNKWEANSLEWYPVWKAKNQNITIVANTLKNSKNEDVSTVNSIKCNNGTLSTNSGVMNLNTTTDQVLYTFAVEQKGGHKLKSVTLTMKISGQTQTFTIDDTKLDYEYYGCQLSYNTQNNRYKVKSQFGYSISQESGNYNFDFATLIGVEKIEFNFQKYEYDAVLKTNIKSLINGYNEAPITIKGKDITRDKGTRLSEIFANASNLQDNEKLFSVNDTILIKDIRVKEGYKLYSITLPTETLSKNPVGISKTDIKQLADGSYSVELTLNSIGSKALYVDDIEIVFNVDRISKDFKFSLNDVDINNDDWKDFEFGINVSVDGAKTDRSIQPRKMNQLNTSVVTDDEVTLTFNGLPYNIKLSASDITVKGIRDGYIVGAGSEPNSFVISNIIIDENAEEYSVSLSCSVPKVDLAIINQSVSNISGQESVKELSTKNVTVPYGSVLTVTKNAGRDKLVVTIASEAQDINEVFEYDLDSKMIEQLSILFENGQASNIKLTSSTIVDWKMYLTYSNLSKYDATDTYKLYLKYTTKAISVHTGDAFIKNGSTTIDDFKLDTSDNQIAGTIDTVLADSVVGYKFLGFYVIQKDLNGKVLGDTFASSLYSGNTSFKYSLNTSSANATQITIDKSTLYIVRVYEAKILTAIFDTTLKDEAINQNINVTLSSTNKVEIEFNTSVLQTILPTVQIDGMYEFVCWQSNTIQINNREFKIDDKYAVDDKNNTVTFTIKASPSTVSLTLYSDPSTEFSTVTISYGTTDYSKLPQPSKFGYKLVGWKYKYKESDGEINKSKDGQVYVTIENGKIVKNSCKQFDIQSKTVDFVAVYDANIISNIIFRAGGINNEGQFVSGQKEYTSQVRFGTSDYQSELFSLSTFVPTWQTDYATYEFAYFIFNGNKNKIFDPNSTDEARKYVIQSNEISGEMIFTAYYKVTDFVTPTIVGNENNWTYDAQSRSLSIDFAGKQNTNVLTYTYAWYKDGKALAGQTEVILDNIKNVVDSGKYTCKIKVNAQNEYAFTESQIEKETQEFSITISPKEIWFTQNGEITTELVKVFDNTNKTDSTVDFAGVCGGDSITVIVIYDNVNVGTNIPMTVTITSVGSTTDVRNYTYPKDITGKITPYELNFVLKNKSNNYIVKNGEDNLQINIKEYYTITSDDSSFIQKYGFAIDYELKTSQNIVGGYSFNSQNANKILLEFTLRSGNKNNFVGTVDDDFFIKDSDENSVTISIKVLSNDNKSNEQVDSSLAYITANSIISSDSDKGHIFNISNNNSSNITIIEKRDYLLRNPSINLKLIINEQSKDYGYIYWIESWQIQNDGKVVDNNFADNSNITYILENNSVKQIIINCYITTLSSVEYDYNLADGENIDGKVALTKFAYAKPISYSVENYNARFPIPTRDGFDFIAWTNGTSNVTSSTIWDKKYTKLTAVWQLQDIAVDNDDIKENFVYDSVMHQYTFTITNSNAKAIEYTYKWASTAKIAGSQAGSTLRVKNVKNSGVYTLTITATSKGVSKSLTRIVDVTITPCDLLKDIIEISKQYDKTAVMSTLTLDGVAGEKVYVSGSYKDKNAGSLLDKSSLKYVIKNGDLEIESKFNDNYNFDLSKISDQSRITPKDISITFEDRSKVFDKLPLKVTGDFVEKDIAFSYTIKTAKIINEVLTECGDVGTYNQQNGNLKVEIKNELLSNFNITMSGTLTINYKSIFNGDVEWVGDKNVVFDGKEHILTLSDEFKDAIESYKYEKASVTLSSLPVTVGEYKVIAKFKENCGYDVQEEIQATLTITQRILNITYDSSKGKIEKYYDSTNTVTKDISEFNIETIVSGYEPAFIYNYRTVNAGDNIAIDILLDENNENNKNYILAFPNGTIFGTIKKAQVEVMVNGVSKQYDGTSIFEVEAKNIQATGLVADEDVDGSVKFIAKEVGKYTNQNSTLEINKDALLFGNKVYSINYEITSFAYDIEIIKAKLNLACSPASPYTYNGLAIDITYELTRSDNLKNASMPETLEKVYYIKNGAEYSQIDYQPLQVGDYQIEFKLSEKDAVNFEIISTQTQFDYTITQRKLSIKFQTEYEYTGDKITYKVDKAQNDIYILSKDIADNTLGAGDSISWIFVTTDKDCGTYYVAQSALVDPAKITIYKGNEDYTHNYEIIIHAEAQIIIKQAGIDRSQVTISSKEDVYNAQVYYLTFSVNGIQEDYTYKSIKRSGVLVNGADDIKYAGEYSLEIELKNYKIANNKPFTYTITKKDVDLDLLEISKIYDGKTNVEGSDYKFKDNFGICPEDENLAYIVATYDNKNVGEKKKVKFELKSSSTLIENSYNLLTTFGYGDILKSDQTMTLKTDYSIFYNGKTVEIDISNFIPTELVNREVLSGKISLNIKDVGTYDLSTNAIDLSKLKISLASGTSEGLDNYNLSFNGTIEIKPALVTVNVKFLQYVYNAKEQTPEFEESIYDSMGEIVDDFTYNVEYLKNNISVRPINAGEYNIKISLPENSNYRFVRLDNGQPIPQTELIFDEKLNIAKRKIAIDVGDTITRRYKEGINATYQVEAKDIIDPTAERTEGLLSIHKLVATLSTNDSIAKTYQVDGLPNNLVFDKTSEIYIQSLKITQTEEDVTENYSIEALTCTIVISNTSEEFDTEALETLVYNGKDKFADGEVYVIFLINGVENRFDVNNNTYEGQIVISDITYKGESTNKIINAGKYSIRLRIAVKGFNPIDTTVEFDVKQKEILIVDCDTSKEYDATSKVLGSLTSQDICSKDGNQDDVTIEANYYNDNGEIVTGVGDYVIKFTISGQDSLNYTIDDLTLKGEIKARKVSLKVKDGYTLTFNNEIQYVDVANLEIVSGSIVNEQSLAGRIKINNQNAGSYELNLANIDVQELKVKNGTDDFTSNYEFNFEGDVTINSKNVDIAVKKFNLVYNGQVQTINEYLTFDSLEDELQDVAKVALTVSYDKEVVDAGSYEATVSSNTNNFVFNVLDHADNKIEFKVSKRAIIFSLGDNPIEKVYNPTSDHRSKIEPEFVSGLIDGQELKGEYRLSKVGLGVGTYTQNPSDNKDGYVIFENLEIIAKGENIIDKNYDVIGKSGAIEIVPFEISKSDAYLSQTQIVYSKAEALDSLAFTFFDTNKQLQTITTKDTTLGTISLVEDSAINVGTYHVKVTINNCELVDGDEYEFEIIPFTITEVDYLSEKEYDATSSVTNINNSTVLSSSQVFAGDSIEIEGTYVDRDNIAVKNASQDEYSIVFAIKNADTLPAKNYILNVTGKGKITQRVITLNVNKELSYKASGEYAIPYKEEYFTMVGTIVSGQTLEGIVKFNKQDTLGAIDLTQIDLSGLTVIDSESINQTANYLFKLSGNVSIVKSKIKIDFTGISYIYIYSNSIVQIKPIISYVDESIQEALPTLTYNYKSTEYNSEEAPKYVGEYTFTVVLNSTFYEFATDNTFTFEIQKYDFVVKNGDIPADKFGKNYGSADPQLIFTITTDLNESINLYFTRTPGEDVGLYDIQLENCDNKNYNVTLESGKDLFTIKKALSTTVIILSTEKNIRILQKQYDTQNISPVDITLLDYDANGEILTGTITFEDGVDVGSYKVSTWTLSSLNFEQFDLTSEVEYVISKKDIILKGENLDKPYDKSTKFYGTITILDSSNVELDENIYHLSAYGQYEEQNISDNAKIIVNLAGGNVSNFNITNSLFGKITKRNVKIVPTSGQESVYGTNNFDILYSIEDLETTDFNGDYNSEVNGALYIEFLSGETKFIVGNYPIKSNITSENFNLSFDDSVQFTINQKELTISNSNNFIKEFDGNNIVLGEFTIENGLASGDDVVISAKYFNSDLDEDSTVGIDKIVRFILSGKDGKNYFAGDVKGAITNKLVKLNFVYYVTNSGMINPNLIEDNGTSNYDLIYDRKISETYTFMPQPRHEGYTFVGWFWDEDFTNQITLNTTIDSSVWSIDEAERSAYAKWEIKTFDVKLVNVTKVNGVYSDDASLQGGTTSVIDGKYEYYRVISLNDIATPKNGYVFVGYSDDINASVNEEFANVGYTVLAKDNVIYAKYDPKTVKLTLFANEGQFTNSQKWTFESGNTYAIIEIDFNSKLSDYGITIPDATRDGYTMSGWQDLDGNNVSFDANTILGENYFPEKILYVTWTARNYKLVLSANGGTYGDFDTNIWTVEERDQNGNVVKVSKEVSYDSKLGELIEPTKKGWTFDSYTNSITTDFVFKQLSDLSADAQYTENNYVLTIISRHHDIKIELRNKENVLISNHSLTAGSSITIDVMTTNNATITATDTMGYIFKDWTSTYNLTDKTSPTIQILEFMQDETLTANYDFKENTITLKVNDKTKGYAYSGEHSTQGVGEVTFVAKTESVVNLAATSFEGYQLSDWVVDSNGINFNLSGSDADSIRELSNFICDITITVNFEPKTVNITIIADEMKGSISIDGVVNSVYSYTYGALVDSNFTFTVTANHGYSVDTDTANWNFETTSTSKGNFVIKQNGNVYTITFTKFYENGTITIPFTTNKYNVKFIAVYRDENTFSRDLDAESLITVQRSGQSDVVLNSNTPYEAIYKTQVKLIPRLNVKEGYTFSSWSKSGSSEYMLSSMEGLVATYEDDSIDFEIIDNITVYLIYTINTYTIKFSVNDYQKGNIVYNDGIPQTNFAVTVRYGHNTQKVEAQNNEHFVFEKWVKVVDGVYQDYSTDEMLQLTDVKSDMEFVAMFKGQSIVITVKLVLPEEEILEPVTDFGELEVTENSVTKLIKSEKQTNSIIYEISTLASEVVTLKYLEENGFVLANNSSTDNNITLSNIFESTEVVISLRARYNAVLVEVIGDVKGAELTYDSNTTQGLITYRDFGNQRSFEFSVRTGGKVGMQLKINPGYMLVSNEYFTTPTITPDGVTSLSKGLVSNIKGDMVISVQIKAFTYNVTFNFNYENCPESATGTIKSGESVFNPALASSVMNPTRAKYNFVGWGLQSGSLDASYVFENGNIYYYSFDGQARVKTLGFYGSEFSEVSHTEGIDYECTLYAMWELVTYKVDVVLVPSSTLSKIVYDEVFPAKEGRKPVYRDLQKYEVIGIRYEPGSQVIINAPIGNRGYRYYGWSYEEGIKDRTLLNTEQFSIEMPEEDIVVYLYYTLEVSIESYGNGEATISTQEVLYGEAITVNAIPNDGYTFYYWTVNGSTIQDSTAQMSFVIEQPTTIFAKFLGKEVDVRLKQVNNATLSIESKIQDVEGKFRVGDTIVFGVKDITYGYYHKSWDGEYSGVIGNLTYRITKEDAVRGYVKFSLVISQKTVRVEFIVDGAEGGEFEFDGQKSISVTKTFNYDNYLDIVLLTSKRYELVSLTLNDVTIDANTRQLLVHKDNGFDADSTNTIRAKFCKTLWIEVYEMFAGYGTQSDPYVIYNERQIAAMAYLINNNIPAETTIPYAQGYYVLKSDMNLDERFWQPIGTKENPFDGTFDYIDNSVINLELDQYYEVINQNGLFGYITENAKFIRSQANYTLAIVLISSIILLIILIVLILWLWTRHKKKKMEKLATISSVAQNQKMMDEILKSNKTAEQNQKAEIDNKDKNNSKGG